MTLQWTAKGTDCHVSNDGRYTLRKEDRLWVASVYAGTRCIHTFPTTQLWTAEALCLAVEVGLQLGDILALDETADHEPLSEMPEITYEVVS